MTILTNNCPSCEGRKDKIKNNLSHMKKILLTTALILSIIISGFSQIPENAEAVNPLKVGDKIPSVELTSVEGKQINTLDIVKDKPSVVIFYRGGWCPFCNKHLEAIGQSKEEILKLGYQIIAISPDSPEKLNKTAGKNDLSYDLYSDSDGKLMTEMGIAFQAPKRYKGMLEKYSDDKNSGLLPVPSLFIINTKGQILYSYVNADYKNRIDAEFLINLLKEQQQ